MKIYMHGVKVMVFTFENGNYFLTLGSIFRELDYHKKYRHMVIFIP